MKVTVAICTWNRASLLDRTLSSMHELASPPAFEWELLVVNNNCTDETDEVIACYAKRLPIRRLFEPKPGLSNARNCAVVAARGELIVWTDDDVLVERNWLSAYVDAAERWSDAVFFGGRIAPWYEVPAPQWIEQHRSRLEGMLVIRDFGDEERELDATEVVFGANMAFRRSVFERLRFDPELGRKGNDATLGEETALQTALRNIGLKGVWVPVAGVRHFVPAHRLTAKYVWKYWEGHGRTMVRWQGELEGVRLWGAPRWMYRRYWRERRRAAYRRLVGREDWVIPYIEAARLRGAIGECRRAGADDGEHKVVAAKV